MNHEQSRRVSLEFAAFIGRHLRSERFTAIDVGCAGGIDPAWRAFGERLRVLALDASVEECRRLAAAEPSGNIIYKGAFVGLPPDHPFAAIVAGKPRYVNDPFPRFSAQRAADLTRDRLESASLDEKLSNNAWRMTALADPERPVVLAEEVAALGWNDVDLIKIDIDGPDYQVLQSLDGQLESLGVLAARMEVNLFGGTGEWEHVFHNTEKFMRSRGFDLYALEPRRYAMAALPAPFAIRAPAQTVTGRVFQAEAYYARDLASSHARAFTDRWSGEKLAKLAAIFALWNQPDSAAELILGFRDRVSGLFDVDRALDLLAAQSQPASASPRDFTTYRERCRDHPETLLPDPQRYSPSLMARATAALDAYRNAWKVPPHRSLEGDPPVSTPFAARVRRALGSAHFSAIDVGCALGIETPLRVFGDRLRAIGIDASADECQRLARQETLPGVSYRAGLATLPADHLRAALFVGRPAFVHNPMPRTSAWQHSRQRADRADASHLEKIHRNDWQMTRTVGSGERLDIAALVAQSGWSDLDYVKIDIDGADFQVLRSLEGHLDRLSVLALGLEVNLFGGDADWEHTFHNTDRFMRECGFELFALEPRNYSMATLPQPFILPWPAETVRGRVVQADAFYARDPAAAYWQDAARRMTPLKLIKLAALFSLRQQPDSAAELLIVFRDSIAGLVDVDAALDELARQAQPDALFPLGYRDYIARFDADPSAFHAPDYANVSLRQRLRAAARAWQRPWLLSRR
ncbi:MAG: FkbM family methyltransferase [Alphaproteobacteria bacterium]|nr:FkbM family methyltransferase [Alphaproteobacteria bacterium]